MKQKSRLKDYNRNSIYPKSDQAQPKKELREDMASKRRLKQLGAFFRYVQNKICKLLYN